MTTRTFPNAYVVFVILVLLLWTGYLVTSGEWWLLWENIRVIITMVAGAFIAGSSPEGSAAVAYPVFTLYLDISPHDARNFAFAIQSIGMTSASLFILGRRIPIDASYVGYVTAGGMLGLLAGTWYLVPYVAPATAKLTFVSLWLSFGIVLFLRNRSAYADVPILPPLQRRDMVYLIFFGIAGGAISSVFGTGINMLSFCFVVLYYRLNEKVATPSSILIMTMETIAGFLLHAFVVRDISANSWNMWLACIPVVLFMAPFGAWFTSRINQRSFQRFLYGIFLVQYVGAMWVIRPNLLQALLSAGILLGGIALFRWIHRLSPTPSVSTSGSL